MSVEFLQWPTEEQLQPTVAPEQILVDVTNRCPLACKRCPQPILRVQPGYQPGDMSVELFQRLVDQTPQSTIITITGDGEPMVVTRIAEMVQSATNKGVVIRIITSGLIMPEKIMRALLEANLDFIDFSLDAATKESYDQVRLDSNFDKVMGNVNRFLELRDKIQGDKPTTKVLVNMMDQPETHDEIPMFHQIWGGKVDRVYVRPLHSVAGFIPMDNIDNMGDTGNPTHRIPCRVLYDRLVVDHKGNVFFCPLGWGRKEAVVGSITDQTIQEIWNGEKLNQIRQSHIAHSISFDRLCFNCPDWKSFAWGNSSGSYLNQLKERD